MEDWKNACTGMEVTFMTSSRNKWHTMYSKMAYLQYGKQKPFI
jgi:hypothetical protein